MADRVKGENNRKKVKSFHKKGAVKKRISSSKGGFRVKSGSGAKSRRLVNISKSKISKNLDVKHERRVGDDNKPIEVLMAALATMPSLNVDDLLKHYVEAKENPIAGEVVEGKVITKKKISKGPLKARRIQSKRKTPTLNKVDKTPTRPIESRSKLGAGKSALKIQPRKSVPKSTEPPKIVKIEEEEDTDEAEEPAQKSTVMIVQTAQVVQNTQCAVEKEEKSESGIKSPNSITASATVENQKAQENQKAPPKKDAEDNRQDALVGLYMRRQEQVEKEFLSVCQYVNRKKFNQLKILADEAIKNETTYALCGHSNGYQSVKKFFQSKSGWVERFANPDEKPLQYNNLVPAPNNDLLVLSKLISRVPVKFIWAEGLINWSNIGFSTIVNKFPYSSRSISTKTGLLQYIQNQHWTYSANFSYVKYPRTVSITNEDDMKYFATQYRISACVSMLKHFVESYDEKKDLVVDTGVIPIECLDFAVQRICEFVTFEEGTDVDQWNISMVTEDDWILYLLRFLDVAHFNAKYKNSSDYDIPKLVDCARKCVNKVREFWPDIDHEGIKNLWMVKPGASSCGRGIRIFKSLVEIANHCKPGFSYIAQKYIERPMLIHKTKFDIRQWFLVTSIQPMIVYMYDICYLRFCSKEFSLINLHESVHLSNNSVQSRYQNLPTRNGDLPPDNMWDSDHFLSYLRGRKEDDKWFAITLPGIRKGIVGALLASQEGMVHRANCFNLYGADFMLTEDFVPWLIEINAGPCLRNTTTVTSRLCPMVIEDTLNLIVRLKNGAEVTECGHYKLIYSQKIFPRNVEQKTDLNVRGSKVIIHTEKPTAEVPYTVGYFSRKVNKSSNETTADVDKLNMYNSRTMNYEKVSYYKKSNREYSGFQLSKYNGHNVPLGPGSILSRYDNSIALSLSRSAFANSREQLAQISQPVSQNKPHPTPAPAQPVAVKPQNTPIINYIINSPKLDLGTIKTENSLQKKAEKPPTSTQSRTIQYRPPLPVNLKVLAKKW